MAGITTRYALLIGLALAWTSPVLAAQLITHGYAQWLEGVRSEALQSGISTATLDRALDGIVPDPTVVTLDQKQPEKSIGFEQYLKNVVTPERVRHGKDMLQLHRKVLTELAAKYGVPPEVIVALWGIESSFGKNQGNFNVIRSLLTLAYEGRRAEFFRSELMNALKILDAAGSGEGSLRGSWAGAMGQCQFMPSTYLKHSVDGDGDGRRDIWADEADVFTSIANYLAAEGWRAGMSWGYEVAASPYVQRQMVGAEFLRPITDWRQLGVVKKNNSPLLDDGLAYALVAPDGAGGRSFLVTDNFRALMRWNRSTYFGVAVGYMADRIKQ